VHRQRPDLYDAVRYLDGPELSVAALAKGAKLANGMKGIALSARQLATIRGLGAPKARPTWLSSFQRYGSERCSPNERALVRKGHFTPRADLRSPAAGRGACEEVAYMRNDVRRESTPFSVVRV